ncbi:SbtR family transcriptional regulator [Prauserella aidingensis]|uniref:SbtR family transcriptional regulator n=1 Tax=Prauserella aidingensis TaxID=387890 RepID=UPI003555E3B1
MTAKATELETSSSPEDALVSWLRDCVACATEYHGVTELMAAAVGGTESALHACCVAMRAAGARLLIRAQDAGVARTELDGTELFALVAALAWLGDQSSLEPRVDHLFDGVASAILMNAGSEAVEALTVVHGCRRARTPCGRVRQPAGSDCLAAMRSPW